MPKSAQKTVIVIEDEEIISRVLKERLEAEGWSVRTAADGQEAITLLGSELPDLVLLDLMLPKMNGFEVLEYIRGRAELSKVPVVVLSNLGDDEDVRRAMKLGANEYFIKTRHPIGEVIEKAETYVHSK